MSRKSRELLSTSMKTLILVFLFAFFMFPIFWVFLTSIKRPVDQLSIPPVWIPENPDFSNYTNLFSHPDFSISLVNSIIISSITTIITVILGALAAYSIARFKTGGKSLSNLVLMTRMIPPVVIIIPIFLVAVNLNLLDTYFLMILTYSALNMALAIWLLRDFFEAVPLSMEEAAMIDGCTRMQALFKVVFPVVKNGLFSTGLIIFIFTWNEFLFALTLTNETATTMPVLISKFISEKGLDRGIMSAAGIISSIPIILVTILFQKQLIAGLTSGSDK